MGQSRVPKPFAGWPVQARCRRQYCEDLASDHHRWLGPCTRCGRCRRMIRSAYNRRVLLSLLAAWRV